MELTVAVYDACILYSAFLRDFLVRLAVQGKRRGVLSARWTGRIHQEWMGAVRRQRPSVPRANLLRARRLMDEHVRGCRVRGYQRWERRLQLPDPDDRHVLAAALACIADVIVTFNTADFPTEGLRPFGIQAVEPDLFVLRFVDTGIVAATAAEQQSALSRPALSVAEYLDALRANGLPETATVLSASPFVR
jgi:hypothetical protein